MVRGNVDSHNRKIAGLLKQIYIISWKNSILFRRNKLGFISEILFSSLFTIIFVLLVYYSSPTFMPKKKSELENVIVQSDPTSGPDFLTFLLYYYPNNKFIGEIMNKSIDLFHFKKGLVRTFPTNNISDANLLLDYQKESMLAFVSFPSYYESFDSLPNQIQYSIYTKESSQIQSYKTNEILLDKYKYMFENSPEFQCQRHDESFNKYAIFNSIKHSIDSTLINLYLNKSNSSTQFNHNQVKIGQFECPEYVDDLMKSTISFLTPVLVSLSFLATFLVGISNIITEKEAKMKEYLKLVGVKPVVIWICWMIRSLIVYVIISFIVTFMGTYRIDYTGYSFFGKRKKALFLNTDSLVIFSTCFIYSFQVTCLSLLIGQIFKRTFTAKTVSIIFWFVTLINFYDSVKSLFYKYLLCIFPNTALNFAIQVIFQYERSSVKFSLENLYTSFFDESLNLGGILTLMILWSIFYLLLSWYIERLFPGEYGIKLPWNFPFLKSYWFDTYKHDIVLNETNEYLQNHNDTNNFFEREPSDLYASVKIRNLTKIFDDTKVVDNLTLNFYENQITGFLGHNGAGKTTVTFMLCGLYSPNSGTAYILDHDIRSSLDKIRSSIGFCPQQNILYDDLTVYEHLFLIAAIKGSPFRDINSEIMRIASFVQLQNDLNKMSKQLSGGMKRRLSFGIALIGDSKIIILDEPSSGLDPFNRRSLWDLIRNYKHGRTIILTTHYMEEADALSDRIALMNHGKVKCVGSPLYLKDKFGSGYRLILTKDENNFDQNYLEYIFKQCTNGLSPVIETNISKEMSISISNNITNKLPCLLNAIEANKNRLGIFNYGISSSTVEEVFLKVGSIDRDEEENNKILPFSNNLSMEVLSERNNNISSSLSPSNHTTHGKSNYFLLDNLSEKFRFYFNNLLINNKSIVNNKYFISLFLKIKNSNKTKEFNLIIQQLKSLWMKRFLIFRSRIIIALFTLILPFLIQAILSNIIPSSSSMITDLFNTIFNRRSIPEYDFSLNKYANHTFPYKTNSNHVNKRFQDYLQNRHNSSVSVLDLSKETTELNDFVFSKRLNNYKNLIYDYFIGVELNYEANTKSLMAKMFYSKMAYHTSGTILSEINSFMLAYYTNDSSKSIKTINKPIAVIPNEASSMKDNKNIDVINCLEVMPFSFLDFIEGIIIAFVISLSTIHLTRENRNGSKSLQLLSGTHYLTYWLSNYLFDFIIFYINITTMVLALKLVFYFNNDNANDTFLLASNGSTLFNLYLFLILTSFSWSTLSYLWSFIFKSDIISFIVLFMTLSFATLLDMILVFIKFFDQFNRQIEVGIGKVTILVDFIRSLLVMLFPNVAAKRAVFNLKIQNSKICIVPLNVLFATNMSPKTSGFDFDEPGIGKFTLLNFFLTIAGFFIIVMIEKKILIKLSNYLSNCLFRRRINSDDFSSDLLEGDVKNESLRIKSLNLSRPSTIRESLVVKDLRKNFKKNGKSFSAVDGLNFGVYSTECFGLLGLNGAGKTTTLEILTGRLDATSGEAYINGFSIKKNRLNAIRSLGYCPQFDHLPEFLTVKETLELFANLRLINKQNINEVVNYYMDIFRLYEFRNKLVQNLSGGNKRKVSSAIAFIGKPKMVILDEPTSGMDVAARRYLWNVIKSHRDMGTTILLTTHSMEECEALCTKLGIMVNGQFQCFGNIQHLKNKYGKGYSLIIKCKYYHEFDDLSSHKNQLIIDNIEKFVEENIENAQLKDKQQQTLFYQIYNLNDSTTTIAKIFELIETNKEMLNIETYSLSQTTLDQIFLSFARKQHSIDHHILTVNTFNISEINEKRISDTIHNNLERSSDNLAIPKNNNSNKKGKMFPFNNRIFNISPNSQNNGSVSSYEPIEMKDL